MKEEEVKLSIVEQGYTSNDPQFYMLGIINPNSKEKVPCIATKHKRKIFCARVKVLDSTTKSYKYFKADKLPGEVVKFLDDNGYNRV